MLLRAVDVGITDRARAYRARYGGFDRVRRVVVHDRQDPVQWEPIQARDQLPGYQSLSLHQVIALAILEHNVQRDLERTCVLATNDFGQPCDVNCLSHLCLPSALDMSPISGGSTWTSGTVGCGLPSTAYDSTR